MGTVTPLLTGVGHTPPSHPYTMRIPASLLLLLLGLCVITQAKQRRPAKLGSGQGLAPCKDSGSRRVWNFGYGELKSAEIYDQDRKLVTVSTDDDKALQFKVDRLYTIKVKFLVKKFSPFGSIPKYMGIKISEKYTKADPGVQAVFQQIYKKKMIGEEHACSVSQGGDNADGCKHLTAKYKDTCPFDKEDQEVEIEVPFRASKLPSAVTETQFRLIGLEERVDGRGCGSILSVSQGSTVETTSDQDMICFKYKTKIFR